MIKDAETFKAADKEFSSKHEAKQELESYIASVEATITGPEAGLKMKRGAKANIETELAKALEKLEIEDSTTDELRKSHLTLKRAMQKGLSGGR
jgi:L1 cell adhesion molecule like protein